MQKPIVCICGGGSQGHISAGVIGSNDNYITNIFTRQPHRWIKEFKTIDLKGKEYRAHLNEITSNPGIISKSDIILICLPGYAIADELEKIKPYITPNSIVGSVFAGSGFFLQAIKVLDTSTKCFGLQRVPFTGRPIEYGKSARLKGYKPYLKVATMNMSATETDKVASMLENWYKTPVYKLSHYLEATLSNSNPILHPVRLYVLFKDWTPEKVYQRIPYLYDTDWDDETSQLWIDCDNELREILKRLPVDQKQIPSILEYYSVDSVKTLTKKMQSIEPFKGVQPHMIEVEGGYKLDPNHRYFIEDIPFGLLIIKEFADKVNVSTPKIDMLLEWAQKIMGKEYIKDGKLIKSINKDK